MKLTYKPLANEEILRVSCEGQLSTRGRPASIEPLQELLGPQAYRQKVVLNLERADGVDTSGLIWLVKAATRFGQGGGRLVVYGFTPTFKQMLEVLGLSGSVVLVTSEQLAIETVNRSFDELKPTVNGEAHPAPRILSTPTAP